MGVGSSTYYAFTRVREASPSIKDWAATDGNFELLSLLLKAFEQHTHTGGVAFDYPGYNVAVPTNPTLPTLTETTTGGVLSPGVKVGTRLSYKNALGLETAAAPETQIQLTAAATRPLTPILVSKQAASPGLPGGTYIYAITKKKGSGETLISDTLAVDILYDTTYSVTLQFDAINTYTDGTTGLNIYRAQGLNSSFQLVTTITNTVSTTFVDTNTIAPGNQNVQPPSANTFDAAKKVRIGWAALVYPPGATKLCVYVTQQTGIWANNSLLTEIDLTGAPANFVDYLGSETLQPGSPNNTSQIPNAPAKLNLGLEATGAPILTANMNFAGFEAQNMKLHVTTTPTVANGAIYYDSSIPTVRARINGAWVNWGTTTASAYNHPAEEVGGHTADKIKFIPGSAITSKTIFDTMRNADGTQKNAIKVFKATGSTSDATTTSQTSVLLPEMTYTIQADFTGQWLECFFSALFRGSVMFMNVNFAIEYAGSTLEETVRSATIAATNGYVSGYTSVALQAPNTTANTFRVLWWVDTGTATAVGLRRSMIAKVLF